MNKLQSMSSYFAKSDIRAQLPLFQTAANVSLPPFAHVSRSAALVSLWAHSGLEGDAKTIHFAIGEI